MKVIIAGNRDFANDGLLKNVCDKFHAEHTVTEVVSGCASGADTLGEQWAARNRIPVKKFHAEWQTYGRSAGPLRNKQMAEYADALILFDFGIGRGSASMRAEAKKRDLVIVEANAIRNVNIGDMQ